MNSADKIIAVTGATGQQGSATARHLLSAGWKVRALTRDLKKPAAVQLKKAGAELVYGDMDKPQDLKAAFKGVSGVFSVQNFWLPNVGSEGEVRQGKLVAQVALDAGVSHFVYSSAAAAHRGMGQAHFASKLEIEWYIKGLGLPATILRPVAFMDNFNWSRSSILSGVFRGMGLSPEKTIQLIAGDELTEKQIAEAYSRVIGRPVILGSPIFNMAKMTEEQRSAMTFFNSEAYTVDVVNCRKLYPSLLTFEQYLERNGWRNARPEPLADSNQRRGK